MDKKLKGQTGPLISAFLGFAILVIVVAVSMLIGANTLTQVQTITGSTTNSAYLGVNETVKATYQMTQWLPIVVVVIIGSILLGLVLSAFRARF